MAEVLLCCPWATVRTDVQRAASARFVGCKRGLPSAGGMNSNLATAALLACRHAARITPANLQVSNSRLKQASTTIACVSTNPRLLLFPVQYGMQSRFDILVRVADSLREPGMAQRRRVPKLISTPAPGINETSFRSH